MLAQSAPTNIACPSNACKPQPYHWDNTCAYTDTQTRTHIHSCKCAMSMSMQLGGIQTSDPTLDSLPSMAIPCCNLNEQLCNQCCGTLHRPRVCMPCRRQERSSSPEKKAFNPADSFYSPSIVPAPQPTPLGPLEQLHAAMPRSLAQLRQLQKPGHLKCVCSVLRRCMQLCGLCT